MKKYLCDICLKEIDTTVDEPTIVWNKYLGYRFQDVCKECRVAVQELEAAFKAEMKTAFLQKLEAIKKSRQAVTKANA